MITIYAHVYAVLIVSNPLEVRETFSYREDKLTLRVTNSRNGQVHEQFSPGRSNHLKGKYTHTRIPYTKNNLARIKFYEK